MNADIIIAGFISVILVLYYFVVVRVLFRAGSSTY